MSEVYPVIAETSYNSEVELVDRVARILWPRLPDTTQWEELPYRLRDTLRARASEAIAYVREVDAQRASRASPDRAETGTGSVSEANSTRSREAGGA